MEQLEPFQLIAEEYPRLIQELRDVPADAWTASSRCAGWSNAWVVAHLTLGAETYLDSVTRALKGDCTPPAGPSGAPITLEDFRLRQRSRAEALVQGPTNKLLDGLVASTGALIDIFRRLAPTDRDRPAWHPRGTVTIGTLVAYRVFELGFHRWDICASLDPDASIRPELCGFLLRLVRELQPRLCRPATDLTGTCRFEIDGQAWTVRAAGGKLVEDDSMSVTPDIIIRTDSSTFLLLATSRRNLADCADRAFVKREHPQADELFGAMCLRI